MKIELLLISALVLWITDGILTDSKIEKQGKKRIEFINKFYDEHEYKRNGRSYISKSQNEQLDKELDEKFPYPNKTVIFKLKF